jgi:hypothetical protein
VTDHNNEVRISVMLAVTTPTTPIGADPGLLGEVCNFDADRCD